jgi:hypothetical protein
VIVGVVVIGLADNVVITAWAIRSAIRKSGAAAVRSHWRGSQASFSLLSRLCRLKATPEQRSADRTRPL